MVSKILLIFLITVKGGPGYAVLDEGYKNMDECIAEMHRQSYVYPESERKRFACIKITEMQKPM